VLGGGFQRIVYVQVMRPAFRPILDGMGLGVGTDEFGCQIVVTRAGVIPLQCRRIVAPLVTEEAAKVFVSVSICNQAIEIIMTAFVTEVTQ